MEVSRIFDLLTRYEKCFKVKDNVLAGKENGKWVLHDLEEYQQTALNISCALLKLGIKKGDKIATISNNRPEWNFVDMGIMQIGAVHVPIYPTISAEDYEYILKHAGIKYVFVSGNEIIRKIGHILKAVENINDVYSFTHVEGYKHFNEIIEFGKQNQDLNKIEKIKTSINKDDIATLIYTSGTTGFPKGVMLSHDNILSNVKASQDLFPVDQFSKGLSYLPLCHIYERMVNYVFQYKGVSVYYAENMATIVENIQEIKPHVMTTVPRLLEKVYDKIMAKGRKLRGIQKQIFFWAVNLGLRYQYDRPDRVFYNFQLSLANKLVFNKWREAFGGNMRSIVSGGAALQPRLAQIYNAAKIPVVEGYGMTESSPVIAVNTYIKGKRKIGTVGPPLENVEVEISNIGEILVKGPNVMKGYYKDEEMTRKTIVNGLLHTGDVGIIDNDGMLKITGRVKEIFKTSMGKYVSPVLLENKIKESPFFDQIIVLGENQKFVAALIVPDFEHLSSWCRIKDIDYTTNDKMITSKPIQNRIKKEIDCFNKQFGDTEKIKKFKLIDHEWTIDSGEITANLKLKRSLIQEKYKNDIENLFI
ncbi:MAG: long-chain fatty acid--CoA ligase [Bacteroidales bacterium]|jgi:long-chain acyl-CoA synthetase|nr:long-chain fatty acid--CoA ligase [Lentimicrobiaceae bacterium]MDG1135381.1 long-chain fatty acid--CoA ligase [Bacteroidales bacterium]MDG1901278.1 long-chain fatty acid--CoA ligase [Bacteroidales bacterium]MDG2081554.1 long-chain fatty acid--CoA ligase [Bacteroidales bacterium]|tara:strand:+ start:942 stop:2705 length:1764 start_codon:yes stop_codon:yes gene_type:complete